MYALLVTLLLAAAPVRAQEWRRPPEVNVQYHRAEKAFTSGASMLEAKARVDRVLAAVPDDHEARKLRAQVLLALDRPDEAFLDAMRATMLAPEDGEAHLILAEAARATGARRLAIEALDLAAQHVLDDAAFHVRLSMNAAALGQLDRAEAFARIGLALDAREPAAYYQLARVFVLQRRPQDAAETLARGLRRAILVRSAVAQDTLLAPILSDPSLRDLPR